VFESVLQLMRKLVLEGKMQLQPHAFEAMQDDSLFIFDLEQGILTGKIIERQWDDEFEQFKYVIHGRSSDDEAIGVVAKVDAKPRIYIITTYVL
jgi:hypothetical protein